MRLNKRIDFFFKRYQIDPLNDKDQSVSRFEKNKMDDLRKLIPQYEKEVRIPIKCKCQSSVNDFVNLLRIYLKKNPVE